MLKFIFKVSITQAEALYNILPGAKLLTYNLPPNAQGLVEAVFTSAIGLEELKKIVQQLTNGSAMMETFKISYD